MNDKMITQGVIWKGLLYFFFPILLGTFFQQLYNTVDAIIVGRFVGKEALAAVGGGTTFYLNMLVGFFTGLSGGAGVVISQFYGANNKRECSRSVHTALLLAVIFGIVIMILGIISAKICMTIIGTPYEIMTLSVLYLRLYFCGMLPMVLYNMGSGILRAAGDSRTPFFILLAGCGANIVLDLLFVVYYKLGVAGVAIATVLSEVVCAVITLYVLHRNTSMIAFRYKLLFVTPHIAKKMVLLGLPTGFQSVMYTLSNLIIQANINMLGTDTIAGIAAWEKIDQFFWMTIAAFGIALTTFVGQNIGAGKLERVKKATIQCLAMAMVTTVALTVLFFVLGKSVFMIFIDDKAVIDIGIKLMHFLCPSFVTYVSIEILSGTIRGAGRAKWPTLMTLFGVCVLRLVWMFTVVPMHRSVISIYISYPLSWTVTSILFWVYYLKKSWLKDHLPKSI